MSPSQKEIDQPGFMPNRHIESNLRQLFNKIYREQDTEACLISLNRAFDQIEWPYMFSAIKYGGNFIRWIYILYAKPEASVITNQILSAPLMLHRQRHPLSSYVFAIAMPPA